jgi:hypothetical protein
MISAKGNSGSEKGPTPKHVLMFKGIKGLVASGPGMTKKVDNQKLRPETNEGKKIPSPPSTSSPSKGQSLTQKSAGTVKPHGAVSVRSNIRPEPAIKRDSASVLKPHTN